MSAEQHFSATYALARAQFVQAAEHAGLEVRSHAHPLRGAEGEALAMDVVRLGATDARALLVLSSACHGVEGFSGSGGQVALLRDASFVQAARAAGVAVLFIHALNPFGFSHLRRVTNENVDLNRNFVDFKQALPHNAGYEEIAHWIIPSQWPPTQADEAAAKQFIATRGMPVFQAAVSGGQFGHPTGMFYGGHAPTWSRQTLEHVLADHATRCTDLGWIDFHTGLGPSGHGEKILAGRPDLDAGLLARAKAWWGEDITSTHDGSSTSAALNGTLNHVIYSHCAQARYTGIALEYGTQPLMQVLTALRADHWLYNHPEAPAALRASIKKLLRDAFYVDTAEWKAQVLEQGVRAARQAVAGLAAAR